MVDALACHLFVVIACIGFGSDEVGTGVTHAVDVVRLGALLVHHVVLAHQVVCLAVLVFRIERIFRAYILIRKGECRIDGVIVAFRVVVFDGDIIAVLGVEGKDSAAIALGAPESGVAFAAYLAVVALFYHIVGIFGCFLVIAHIECSFGKQIIGCGLR